MRCNFIIQQLKSGYHVGTKLNVSHCVIVHVSPKPFSQITHYPSLLEVFPFSCDYTGSKHRLSGTDLVYQKTVQDDHHYINML